jgi:hypothetical protein
VAPFADTSVDYTRVYSRLADRWVVRDFVFDAVMAWTPQVHTPAPGATVTSPRMAFGWTAPFGTDGDWLDVGTTAGGTDLFSGSHTNRPARTVTVPLTGGTIYARFWSYNAGNASNWQYVDYAYPTISANGRAVLTEPAQGMLIAQSTARFVWSPATSASQIGWTSAPHREGRICIRRRRA